MVQTSRATKVNLLGRMKPAPAGLVLGSSRVLKLEPHYLESKFGMQFFNAGVNYGKPEDHLAMLRYYHCQFGTYPRLVVLGLDVHGFSDALPFDARLLSNAALVRQIPDAVGWEARWQRWKELLSWQQSTASVKSLCHHLRGRADPEPAESFREDGLLVYHDREQQMAQGTYDFDAALAYNKQEYRQLFANFDRLSPHRIKLFHALVKTCNQHNTQLVVFLTPMHPALADYLGTTCYPQRRGELAHFLSSQAAAMRFAFCDLSEIDQFDGDPAVFVDGIHPLEPNTRRIIDRLTQQMKTTAHYAIQ
jgi:hypothetical protein